MAILSVVLKMCSSPLRTTFTIISRCHPLPVSHFSSHLWQCMPALVPETSPIALVSTVKTDPHMSYWTLFFRILPRNGENSDWHEACHFPVSISRTVLSCVFHKAVRCVYTPSLSSCNGWQPLNNLVYHHCCQDESGVWSRVGLLGSLPTEVSYGSVTATQSWQLVFISLSHNGFYH